jgi:hypothetical protein
MRPPDSCGKAVVKFNYAMKKTSFWSLAGLHRAIPLEGRRVGGADVSDQIMKNIRTERELEASLKEIEDLKAALDEHAIVAITDPQGRITMSTINSARSQNTPARNSSARTIASSIPGCIQRNSCAICGRPSPGEKCGRAK